MLLIGQFDSPFVRRVGITLTLYGLPFRHEPWSVFRNADKIAAVNPLIRVPTLQLDDNTFLTDSHIILDYLERLAPKRRRLIPVKEPSRHQALRVMALAAGIGDKVVSLFYEKRLHDVASDIWVKRCEAQIRDTFALLERERAAQETRFWLGGRMSQADITLACMLRFAREAHPGLVGTEDYPALTRLAARLEKLPAFRAIEQAFIPPA